MKRIEHWMRGTVGVDPPAWVAVLEAAAEWGVPPWQIEAECSEEWWTRFLTYRQGQALARKK